MKPFVAFQLILPFLLSLVHISQAGPLSYAICQTGCNYLAVACYASAGSVFGTITAGLGTPAVILGCNAALGTCMTGCVGWCFAPIP